MKLIKISTLILFFTFNFLLLTFGFTHAQTHGRQHARTIQMIFWYPGEAGTTVDAQGALNPFFEYINRHLAPIQGAVGSSARIGVAPDRVLGVAPDRVLNKASSASLRTLLHKSQITGKYFNTVEEGLTYIKTTRPKLGILSFAAYTINKEKLGPTRVILQTLPLPDGKPTEQYVIVGKGVAPDRVLTLYSKQPMTDTFVNDHIIPPLPPLPKGGVKLIIVPNILPTLKDVASGTKTGAVILQPMEYFTLKNLNQPWAKELTVRHTSRPMPTAPLVVFGEETPLVQKIKDILLKMPQDEEGKEILETLRLNGFKE